jgi:hypothetical protein
VQGWAYQSTCEGWHGGSSSKYFNTYNSGDVITVEVDVDADTLSFFINGEPGGVVRTVWRGRLWLPVAFCSLVCGLVCPFATLCCLACSADLSIRS